MITYDRRGSGRSSQPWTGYDYDTLTADLRALHAKAIAAGASPKGTLDCITAFGRTDLRGDVAAVAVPALVVHGDADAVVPFEVSGERSAAALPGAELVLIEGGPHAINASHAEEFDRALLAFLVD